ncbi:MAG: aminotransferase class I/II-fold pyridoxal phosphate-dependent enzyme, partial [Panacagrimonas sp.]
YSLLTRSQRVSHENLRLRDRAWLEGVERWFQSKAAGKPVNEPAPPMFAPFRLREMALEGPQDCVAEIRHMYKVRRDVLCEGLNSAGWKVAKPKATMFVWAEIPEQFRQLGSIEFSKILLNEAKVAVSPGIGFGEYGDTHVRLALIENEHRTRQAVRGIRKMLKEGPRA